MFWAFRAEGATKRPKIMFFKFLKKVSPIICFDFLHKVTVASNFKIDLNDFLGAKLFFKALRSKDAQNVPKIRFFRFF